MVKNCILGPKKRVDKPKLGQIITLLNFSFGQLFMRIMANNDQILLPLG